MFFFKLVFAVFDVFCYIYGFSDVFLEWFWYGFNMFFLHGSWVF